MGPYNGIGRRDTHVHARIDLYLTGVLPASVRSNFEAHLLRCAACRTAADNHSEVAVSVASLPAQTVVEIENLPPFQPGVAGVAGEGHTVTAHGS